MPPDAREPFDPAPLVAALAEGEVDFDFTFDTRYRSLDILAFPTGAPPYERLRADAMIIEVRGHPVRVASLDHLIAMKEATGRTKDTLHATEYRVISDELRAPRSASESPPPGDAQSARTAD